MHCHSNIPYHKKKEIWLYRAVKRKIFDFDKSFTSTGKKPTDLNREGYQRAQKSEIWKLRKDHKFCFAICAEPLQLNHFSNL